MLCNMNKSHKAVWGCVEDTENYRCMLQSLISKVILIT
jgi:hypothetical protein